MTTGIGLDLGTGLTKLVQRRRNDASASDTSAVRLTQTAVIYRGLASELLGDGTAAHGGTPGVTVCEGFPLMLGAGTTGPVRAFLHRTPSEVAREFLRLLLSTGGGTGREPAGSAQPFVVVAPPAVTRGGIAAPAPGLDSLLDGLGWPPLRLITAPVATLLYLRRYRPDSAAGSRFAICDAGAGIITLSLCIVDHQRIRLIDSVRITGQQVWGPRVANSADAGASPTEPWPVTGQPGAGTGVPWPEESRPFTVVEGLVTALASQAGARTEPGALAPARWRALENVLADNQQNERLAAVLEHAATDPRRFGGTVAVRFADLQVTASHVSQACEPVTRRCAAELAGLLRRQYDPGWRQARGNGPRIVLTGGLSGLFPAPAALLAAAKLDPRQPGPSLVQLDTTERLSAAATGAALVASGEEDPGDRYPHALRLPVHWQAGDQLKDGHVALAAAGAVDLDRAEPIFAVDEDGYPAEVAIPDAAGAGSALPLTVEVVPAGGDHPFPAEFEPRPWPPPGSYRVGVRGGPAGAAVVLQPAGGGPLLAFPLAPPTEGSGGD